MDNVNSIQASDVQLNPTQRGEFTTTISTLTTRINENSKFNGLGLEPYFWSPHPLCPLRPIDSSRQRAARESGP